MSGIPLNYQIYTSIEAASAVAILLLVLATQPLASLPQTTWMDIDISETFDGRCAFSKDESIRVEFKTQSDAMIASLQLFHDVPWSTIDLFITLVTHPEFNTNEITLRSSVDLIREIEKVRLRNRLKDMHERSIGSEGHAGLPRFVLEEVLDIVEAEKVEHIKARFEEDIGDRGYYRLEEDEILSNMSLVHRSWTLPSQKALGRSLYIGNPIRRTSFLYRQIDKSIHGPWTSLIAVDLYYLPEDYDPDISDQIQLNTDGFYNGYDYDKQWCIYERKNFRRWFENLHYLLLGFDNLKSLFLRSYSEVFTEWSDAMVRNVIPQNSRLEVLSLLAAQGTFDLGHLLINKSLSEKLRFLSIQGGMISEDSRTHLRQEGSFANLRNLTMTIDSTGEFEFLPILASQSNIRLESLTLVFSHLHSGDNPSAAKPEAEVSSSQCAMLFAHLHSLCLGGIDVPYWLKWIRPYCSGLKNLFLTVSLDNYADILCMIPPTIQSLSLELGQRLSGKEWEPRILDLLNPNRFSTLKWFTLKIPGRLNCFSISDNWFYDTDESEGSIQAFDKKIHLKCCNAGIMYRLDYSVNHNYKRPRWLDVEF